MPSHLDLTEILEELREIDGLEEVRDVDVWTLASGFVALSGHGVLDEPAEHLRILDDVRERMGRFGIEHVTFQLEQRHLYQLAKEVR